PRPDVWRSGRRADRVDGVDAVPRVAAEEARPPCRPSSGVRAGDDRAVGRHPVLGHWADASAAERDLTHLAVDADTGVGGLAAPVTADLLLADRHRRDQTRRPGWTGLTLWPGVALRALRPRRPRRPRRTGVTLRSLLPSG